MKTAVLRVTMFALAMLLAAPVLIRAADMAPPLKRTVLPTVERVLPETVMQVPGVVEAVDVVEVASPVDDAASGGQVMLRRSEISAPVGSREKRWRAWNRVY